MGGILSPGQQGRIQSVEFILQITQNVHALREDEVYTGLPGGFKMPRVTLYKPNGETLLSTNAKRFEQTKGALILHLEGEHAEAYGATMITTLPYAIQCGHRCDEIASNGH